MQIHYLQGVEMTWGFYMANLGDRIKALRVSKRLNQGQLADLCDVSQPAIAKIERGVTKALKGETLEKLAYHLSSTTTYILNGSSSADNHEADMMAAEMGAIFRDLSLSDKETLLRMARGILPAKDATALPHNKTLLLPHSKGIIK